LESFLPIIQFLLPKFILENFEMTSIDRPDGVFHVYIEEKNADEIDPERKNLLSKLLSDDIGSGFSYPGPSGFSSYQASSVATVARLNIQTGKVVYRDWTEVGKGTRMTSEFAAFLKDISGIGRPTIPTRLTPRPSVGSMALVGKICCGITEIFKAVLTDGIRSLTRKNGCYSPKIWVNTCRLMKRVFRRASCIRS
jgi:hypothetical protein